MQLETTYICVENIEKSLYFYRQFLNQEPLYHNENRWFHFACGLSLYNKKYDEDLINQGKLSHFNQAYLDDFYKTDFPKKNNLVIFNFEVDNLYQEYQRIKNLNIGEVSPIMFVDIHMPYYYFNVIDPDGNTLEVTGQFNPNDNV